ncbi:hypothetical protein ACLOJK_029316 [Asimina triloba]
MASQIDLGRTRQPTTAPFCKSSGRQPRSSSIGGLPTWIGRHQLQAVTAPAIFVRQAPIDEPNSVPSQAPSQAEYEPPDQSSIFHFVCPKCIHARITIDRRSGDRSRSRAHSDRAHQQSWTEAATDPCADSSSNPSNARAHQISAHVQIGCNLQRQEASVHGDSEQADVTRDSQQQISENHLQSILQIRAIRNTASNVFVGIKQADGGGSQQGKSRPLIINP